MRALEGLTKALIGFTAFLLLIGCAEPKPAPGWPSGEARPINVPVNAKKPE